MWYEGLKLHTFGHKRNIKLPFPIFMSITPAHVHDLASIREELANLTLPCVVLDKEYTDHSLAKGFEKRNRVLLCPIKARKGETEPMKQGDRAYQNLYHRKVSSLQQSIEAFFTWIEQKFADSKGFKSTGESRLGFAHFR